MTVVEPIHADVLVGGPPMEAREERLAEGADGLAVRRPPAIAGANALLVAAGALLTLGLTAILLGWWGAARSTILEEQIPYLISGGLLGVALAIVGALVFFAHWLTVLVREGRAQEAARARDHRELLDELRSLRSALTPTEDPDGAAGSDRGERPIRRAPRRP